MASEEVMTVAQEVSTDPTVLALAAYTRSLAVVCGNQCYKNAENKDLCEEAENWFKLFKSNGLKSQKCKTVKDGMKVLFKERGTNNCKGPYRTVILVWTSDKEDYTVSDVIDQFDVIGDTTKLVVFCREPGDADPLFLENEKNALKNWEDVKHKRFSLVYFEGDNANIRCFLRDFYGEMSKTHFTATVRDESDKLYGYPTISEAVKTLQQAKEIYKKKCEHLSSVERLTLEARKFEDCLLKADPELKEAQQTSIKEVNIDESSVGPCYENHRKGLALILFVKYNESDANDWKAICIDKQNLTDLFEWLGYTVSEKEVTDKKSIKKAIEKFSKRDDHLDSCILAVLSHGNNGCLLDDKNQSCQVAELTDIMARSEKLARKPRLFIIRACRNSTKSESGLLKSSRTNTGSEAGQHNDLALQNARWNADTNSVYLIDASPNSSGLIVAYSTADGDFCYKNSFTGSRFINSLCRVYYKRAHELDVVSMINWVNYIMTQARKKIESQAESHAQSQQVSSWTVQTVKRFYFTGLLLNANAECPGSDD